MNDFVFKKAPHNPPHLFLPNAIYMLTACVYERNPLIVSTKRKKDWLEAFQKAAEIYKWQVIAWVILHDHYHAIVQSPQNAETLSKFVGSYHKFTARKWNDEDKSNGRKVWWNYWDTCLLSENEYYIRLRYVFWNPVKHGLSDTPEEYKYSNYREFLTNWQVDINFTTMDQAEDIHEH